MRDVAALPKDSSVDACCVFCFSHRPMMEGCDLRRVLAWTAALVFVGMAGAQAAECNRFAVEVATDPVPHQYPRGLEQAHRLLEKLPHQADTILLGDSLIANWPDDMARRQFRSDHVWNFAVGGSVTQNTLWQLERLPPNDLNPVQIVVLVGTNNLTRDDMPACAIASGIEAVVTAAHEKWPGAKIHVMGIPPRGEDFHFRDDARLEVNEDVRTWARAFAYLDYFEVNASEITCGQYDRPLQAAATGASGKSRCTNYADDFGHFKRPGYEVIFSALSKTR
jgi:platelet-activating factor acetylhydrolase IB subunit beta/gamma